MKLFHVAGLIGAVVLIASVIADDAENAAEQKRFEGRFERHFTNAGGVTFHAVQDIVGDQSTVNTFDDVGNLIESHTATIKFEKRGPVRVFSFFNLRVTAGPNKGHTQLGTSSFIYRLEGDKFTEAWGLLDGDSRLPAVLQWQRVKPK